MVLKWLNRRKQPEAPRLPILPGRTLYAVGDVHGRADLLDRILDKIAADIEQTQPADAALIFLGDYVDRGDESAKVVSYLAQIWRDPPPIELYFLKGNHEAAMLDFLEAPAAAKAWLRFGGLQTLMSYGVGGVTENAPEAALIEAARALRRAVGADIDFLETGLRTHIQFGNVFLCHAAIDPDAPLDGQAEHVLLWGQRDFIARGGGDQAWVVHGHTIFETPSVGINRIGIDTGAYYSGRLTAARITDGSYQFLSTN